MKRISSILLKGLLVIVLFTCASVVLNTSGVKTVNEACASLSQTDIYKYLLEQGFEVYDLHQQQGTENWIARTRMNGIYYNTTVHVKGDEIIDHEDIPL